MRNITIIKAELGKSSEAWMTIKPLRKVLKNWLLAWLANKFPGKTKIKLYRMMGVKIGQNVQLMPDIMMDIFFPELIEIGDGVVIGQGAFIACHEFNPTEFRYGPIKIGARALIGARSFLLPGINIGEMSTVSAQTVVYQDVPARVIAFGSPIQFKEIKERKEEVRAETSQVKIVTAEVNPAPIEAKIETPLTSSTVTAENPSTTTTTATTNTTGTTPAPSVETPKLSLRDLLAKR